MREVRAAVEHLYRAFASVPRPRDIGGCPCCLGRKEVGVLLAKPLRSITPAELSPYASSAFLTVGGAADYLYVPPASWRSRRPTRRGGRTPGVTGRAIRATGPETWAAARRAALAGYLDAVVEESIQDGDHQRLDGWVCAIGRMGLDVRPYLAPIAQSPGAALAYFEANAGGLPRGRPANAFWELPCPAHDALVERFFTPEIARIPFEAYGYVMTRNG